MDWANEAILIIAGASITAIIGLLAAILQWLLMRHRIASDKAWADYETRRDIYLDLVANVHCFFENGDPGLKPIWHATARKVRMVGSDEVVLALNRFTSAAQGSGSDAQQHLFALNLALRRDIRTIDVRPPRGTKLDATAFPLES